MKSGLLKLLNCQRNKTVNEFRLTRQKPYSEGSPGYFDFSARQGHYIRAKCWQEAYAIMLERFPGEIFDVQYWSGSLPLKQGEPLVFWIN